MHDETRSKTYSLIAELHAAALDRLWVEADSLHLESATLGIFFTEIKLDNIASDQCTVPMKSVPEAACCPSSESARNALIETFRLRDGPPPGANLHEEDAFDALLLAPTASGANRRLPTVYA